MDELFYEIMTEEKTRRIDKIINKITELRPNIILLVPAIHPNV